MRLITEADARTIEEVLRAYIQDNTVPARKSLRLANKVRLASIALRELNNKKRRYDDRRIPREAKGRETQPQET